MTPRTCAAFLLCVVALSGCATARKQLAACELNIERQNDLLSKVVARRFGRQPNGYNVLVKAPRTRDARGRLVLEAYRIYPITLPEPETRPEGRQLTVIVDPCKGMVVRAFEPA